MVNVFILTFFGKLFRFKGYFLLKSSILNGEIFIWTFFTLTFFVFLQKVHFYL